MGTAEGPIPRVTVGIPIYNAARTLPLTLRSVFAQTITDWELILVDDGSTDGSLDIIRALKDDRVRVMVDGRNKTVAPRLNEIARAARAPFVARLDADDVMHPRRLEEQLAFMQAHPEVDVVGTEAYSVDSSYRIQGKRPAGSVPTSEREVALYGVFTHSTVLGKTGWFLRNPYSEAPEAKRCEDAELWLRTFSRSHFELMKSPLLFYLEDSADAIGKLRSSNRGRIRMLFRGKGEVRSKPLTLRLAVLATIAIKMAVYEVCWAVGLRQYLIDRRNLPVDAAEAEAARRWLQQVQQYEVAG
jgi:glycosyltransferase involved in cell wall biosynthesis